MERQKPSLPYLHKPVDAHVTQLHNDGRLRVTEIKPKILWEKRSTDYYSQQSQQVSLAERFGTPVQNYEAAAKGLFGENVDLENLTQEQKEKIDAAHLGFQQGILTWLKNREERKNR
jgi:hypothetical protein